jgi:hypothetical protein
VQDFQVPLILPPAVSILVPWQATNRPHMVAVCMQCLAAWRSGPRTLSCVFVMAMGPSIRPSCEVRQHARHPEQRLTECRRAIVALHPCAWRIDVPPCRPEAEQKGPVARPLLWPPQCPW